MKSPWPLICVFILVASCSDRDALLGRGSSPTSDGPSGPNPPTPTMNRIPDASRSDGSDRPTSDRPSTQSESQADAAPVIGPAADAPAVNCGHYFPERQSCPQGAPASCGTGEPPFDKRCTTDADCVAAYYGISCCGTTSRAIGINASETARFNEVQEACGLRCSPLLGCPPANGLTVDDGSVANGQGDIGVTCKQGACTTIATGCGEFSSVNDFEKTCATDADCIAVRHEVCCQPGHILGIHSSEQSRFEAAEAQCKQRRGPCPPCPVPGYDWTSDSSPVADGQSSVACVKGTCKTFATACAGPCPVGRACYACQDGSSAACSRRCRTDDDCRDPAFPHCRNSGWGYSACMAASASCQQ